MSGPCSDCYGTGHAHPPEKGCGDDLPNFDVRWVVRGSTEQYAHDEDEALEKTRAYLASLGLDTEHVEFETEEVSWR